MISYGSTHGFALLVALPEGWAITAFVVECTQNTNSAVLVQIYAEIDLKLCCEESAQASFCFSSLAGQKELPSYFLSNNRLLMLHIVTGHMKDTGQVYETKTIQRQYF